MRIQELNTLDEADLGPALRACVAIDSWVAALLAARPYADAAELLELARSQASRWSTDEVEHALADHPRIGERPAAGGAGADHSRREQAGLDGSDADLATRLREGNRAYEERFGRIYLVRAQGRSGPELLALLEQRLTNDPRTELEVTRDQLAEIALLRLADLVEASPPEVRR